jgi:putative oxidoreductase
MGRVSDAHAVDIALLVFRLAIATVFLAHGIRHIIGGGKIAGTARWFESLGVRPGVVHAWAASVTEIGAGALLGLGILTPVAGAGVIGTMLVAWITNHWKNGFWIFHRPDEGYEYVMMLTLAGLLLAVVGAGEWSIDHAVWGRSLTGVTGLLIALAAGVGGALLLLATCWRPNRHSPDNGIASLLSATRPEEPRALKDTEGAPISRDDCYDGATAPVDRLCPDV